MHKHLPWQNTCCMYNNHSFCIDKSFFNSYIWSISPFYVVSFSIAPKSHFNIDNWIAANFPSGIPDWLLTTADLRLIFFISTAWSFYSLPRLQQYVTFIKHVMRDRSKFPKCNFLFKHLDILHWVLLAMFWFLNCHSLYLSCKA